MWSHTTANSVNSIFFLLYRRRHLFADGTMSQPFHHRSIVIFTFENIFTLLHLYNETSFFFFFHCLLIRSRIIHVLFSKFFVSLLNLYTKIDTEEEEEEKKLNQINGNILCVRRIAPKNCLSILLKPLTISLYCIARNGIRMRCKEISSTKYYCVYSYCDQLLSIGDDIALQIQFNERFVLE